MPQSFFIWNNIDCRAMGITLTGPAALIRPEERVNHVQIPGVSGDLTQVEGDAIYNSYIQTVGFSVKDGQRVGKVYEWLRGGGYVTFSGDPGMKQKARIIGAVTLNKVSRNLDRWQGEVQFYCQPLKEKIIPEDTVTVIVGDGAVVVPVRNNGAVDALPKWVVTPSAETVTVSAGGKSLTMIGRTVGTKFTIDSEIMEVINISGKLRTNKASGDFPILKPGNNEIGGSGWSEIVITKRERYL